MVGRPFYVSLEVDTAIGKYFLNCMNEHSKYFLNCMNKHSKTLVESTEPICVEGFLTFKDVAEIDDYDFVIMVFFFLKIGFFPESTTTKNS